jgi:hypothetical protein
MADQDEDLIKFRAFLANPAVSNKDAGALLIEYSLESVTAHLIALMQPEARERFLMQIHATYLVPGAEGAKGTEGAAGG